MAKDFRGSQLHSWLGELHSEGELLNEGQFTLKKEKAWDKLGAFQLPFKEAWVLKLVQAAARLGVTEIRVYQNWQESRFTLSETRPISRSDIEAAVFELPEYLSMGSQHLGSAIRGLGKGTNHPFCLEYSDGQSDVWTGHRFAERKGGRRVEETFQLTVSHFSFSEGQGSVWNLPSDELKERMLSLSRVLCQHAYISAIPIYIDGRQVNGVHSDPTFGLKLGVRPLALFSARADDALPSFKTLLSKNWTFCPHSDLQVRLESGLDNIPEEHSVLGLVSAFLKLKPGFQPTGELRERAQRAELLWVMDGVVMERESIRLAGQVSFAILVSAEDLETDLTGLSLRKTGQYEERRRKAISVLEAEVRQRRQAWTKRSVSISQDDPITSFLQFLQGTLILLKPWFGGVNVPALEKRRERKKQIEISISQALESVCDQLGRLEKNP